MIGATEGVRSIFEVCRATGIVEPGEVGRWRVDQIVADSPYGEGPGSILRTGRGAVVEGETYTRLYRGGALVMSDTPDELRDLAPILFEAKSRGGRILVNGLGLGCALRGLLSFERVEHIDVVEVDPDVIELIGPYFEGERVTIHEGDAFEFTWPTGTRWSCAWHDVWDELNSSNLTERERPGRSYERLHRKYGRRVDWQGSWGEDFLRRQARAGW